MSAFESGGMADIPSFTNINWMIFCLFHGAFTTALVICRMLEWLQMLRWEVVMK